MASAFPSSFVEPWNELLQTRRQEQSDDFPNYHVENPRCLITTSQPHELYLGIGHSIFSRALLPAILSAQRSLHFVTCYWAPSPTLDDFRKTLIVLADNRVRHGYAEPLRVTIGFSSSGLFQKLLHTSSRSGYVYPPSRWLSLGLPEEDLLQRAGIDLTVKSLFFTPFSVMHPKYLIVDGSQVWIPSCNVSWERWFEGCISLTGDIVEAITRFHHHDWGGLVQDPTGRDDPQTHELELSPPQAVVDVESPTQVYQFPSSDPVPTIFLPSSHHRNPSFSIFPLLSQRNPPVTPLNAALLTLFANARHEITVMTPNVTSWPVLQALLQALERGVNVKIRTSKNMMLVEQLVTAGSATACFLWRFVRQYKALLETGAKDDLEAQLTKPGQLEILYFKPKASRPEEECEPVLSHFKMTLVDGEYLIMGSGNQDRASWWTSQEIGILLHVPGFTGHVLWDQIWAKRSEIYYKSP